MGDRKETGVVGELVDELRLQAWLAEREVKRPSAGGPHQEEASVLARLRDEIRVQLHLGQMEMSDEWQRMESRWKYLMAHDVEPTAEALAQSFDEVARELLAEIRDGYHRMRGDQVDDEG
ncbi:MAG: hypothetical protein KC656_18085 [Myxococcales bacterium]|nr:hypothetical protein [Myxococcales bacterium]MCB9670908.1 hypothetical protein [Alphaproteobacteria bacterium]MCB9691141.1 hypothetical protein [Alphaproteobacteria bacterium]